MANLPARENYDSRLWPKFRLPKGKIQPIVLMRFLTLGVGFTLLPQQKGAFGDRDSEHRL
jgi:hypothetical protein